MSRSSMRVLTGDLRGRRLKVPPGVRPTEGRVREALASMWRGRLDGASVLDLFSGSGAVGLEALSLGASRVCFVDSAPRVLSALKENTAGLKSSGKPVLEIVRGQLPEALNRRLWRPFDVIFADPPYAFEEYDALLAAALPHLADGGEMILEHSIRSSWEDAEPTGFALAEQRTYGETRLSFFTRATS